MKRHFLTLDAMRGIAAIVVVLFHYTESDSHHLFRVGGMVAVDAFFILSGFVISYAYGDKLLKGMSMMKYLIKRVIRLYPMLLLGLGLGILTWRFLFPISSFPLNEVNHSLWLNILFLPSLGSQATFPLDSPLWSLFFEMVASVAFILLIRLEQRTLLFIAVACIILMFFYGIMNPYHNADGTPKFGLFVGGGWDADNFFYGFPRVLYGFIVGMLIYRKWDRIEQLAFYRYFVMLKYKETLFYTSFICVLAFPIFLWGAYYFLFLIILAPIFIALGSRIEPVGKKANEVASFLGFISFPIYCLHRPIGFIVSGYGAKMGASPLLCQATAFFTSILASALLAYVYDAPVRSVLLRLFLPVSKKNTASVGYAKEKRHDRNNLTSNSPNPG